MAAVKRARTPAAVRKRQEPMKMDAMRRRSGFGGVMPKVMMKASAMDSSNFTGTSSFIVGRWSWRALSQERRWLVFGRDYADGRQKSHEIGSA